MVNNDNNNNNRSHREKIFNFISNNDINGLKNYIDKNNIVLRKLEHNRTIPIKRNFLIYSINNNASVEMVKYIINECQYETLNFGSYALDSPLAYAIKNENIELADYLLENGADINYNRTKKNKDLLDQIYEEKKGKNIKKWIKYIISHGFYISMENLKKLIIDNNTSSLKIIINHLTDNHKFILNLLSYYKSKIPLSNKQLKEKISEEKKVIFNDSLFEIAIENANYEAINLFMNYDNRKKEIILYHILNVFEEVNDINSNELNSSLHKKIVFINDIKNGRIKIPVDNYTLDNILHYHEICQQIKKLIEHKNLIHFQSYFQEEKRISKFFIKYLHNMEFDILIYAIEQQETPIEMIEYIIQQYDNLNYFIDLNEDFIRTPLYIAVETEQFNIADILLKYGADINYNYEELLLSKNDEALNYNGHNENIFDYLYQKQRLNHRILKYMFNRDIYLTSDILNNLIDKNETKLLKIIFHQYIFNEQFILNLLSHYQNKIPLSEKALQIKIKREINKIDFDDLMYINAFAINNYDILNLLIRNDNRKQNIIIYDVFNLLNKYSEKGKIFVDKLRSNPHKTDIENIIIENSINIEDKRKTIMEKIKNNDRKGLQNYIEIHRIILQCLYEARNNNDILIYAIENNNTSLDIIKFIISQYTTLNYFTFRIHNNKYIQCNTPLLSAVYRNKFHIADLLLKNGADINFNIHGVNILYYLCENTPTCKRALRYVIHHGIDLTYNTLFKLIISMNNEMLNRILKYYTFGPPFIINMIYFSKKKLALSNQQLKYLIAKEKDKLKINNPIYRVALENYNFNGLEILLNYSNHRRKTIEYLNICNRSQSIFRGKIENIVREGKLEMLKILFANNINISGDDWFHNLPLIYAIKAENYEIIKYLIGRSNNNAQEIDKKDLINLVKHGKLKILKLLISNYLNLNENKGYELMLEAIKCNNEKIIKYFLDTNICHQNIYNVFEPIIQNGKLNILKLLLENNNNINNNYKIDINMKDNKNHTPLDYALKYKNLEIIKYIIECGADINNINDQIVKDTEKDLLDLIHFL
ncbi:ankyrin [Anaeromyces robustus]|uniref:Ankyrin n=1 Tax=Anaeromyces robustus TaxID=1754192 RepID=A0A1Y1WZN4_9FUNG|nr:ankyrin [Anaeromyces robustus]|eukprot:ORX79057.1 ankyrin [Anaeromyces robustus]